MARRLISVCACVVILLGLGLLGLGFSGFAFTSLRGESMEPNLPVGSLVVSRAADPQDVRVGDVVIFPHWDKEQPDLVVHRVVELGVTGQQVIISTKGDNNQVLDPSRLKLGRPIDRVVLTIPYMGWVVTSAVSWSFVNLSMLLGFIALVRRIRGSRQARA